MEIEVMFDDIRVKEKVRCKKYFIDLDLKIAQKVFVKLQCNSCTKKISLPQELRCREEELRKALLQQKIQEELLKKRERVGLLHSEKTNVYYIYNQFSIDLVK